MILDDDPDVARIIAFIAQAQGFRVESHHQPADFLEKVARERPSHVALDLVLPGMDGVEVIRQLAAGGCRATVILTSGMGHRILDAARETARERGLQVAGVLAKPFLPQTLRELLALPGGSVDEAIVPADPTARATAGELREAIAGGAITIALQPKLHLGTGRVAGVEALARWQHPGFGAVPPDLFVGLAEASDQVDALTATVLAQALDWFAGSPLRETGSVSINLSAASLPDVALADRLEAACMAAGIAPPAVILEITETTAMGRMADSFDTLTRLRLKGFRLSVDDFGTGWSSLTQLARLPVSEVKIDRSFIAGLSTRPELRKIVDATIRLARGMELDCVAEGVEDAQTLVALAALGCTLAQGYHIARPMPPPAFDQWLAVRG